MTSRDIARVSGLKFDSNKIKKPSFDLAYKNCTIKRKLIGNAKKIYTAIEKYYKSVSTSTPYSETTAFNSSRYIAACCVNLVFL